MLDTISRASVKEDCRLTWICNPRTAVTRSPVAGNPKILSCGVERLGGNLVIPPQFNSSPTLLVREGRLRELVSAREERNAASLFKRDTQRASSVIGWSRYQAKECGVKGFGLRFGARLFSGQRVGTRSNNAAYVPVDRSNTEIKDPIEAKHFFGDPFDTRTVQSILSTESRCILN